MTFRRPAHPPHQERSNLQRAASLAEAGSSSAVVFALIAIAEELAIMNAPFVYFEEDGQ